MDNEIKLPTKEEVERQIWKIAKIPSLGDTQLEACKTLLNLIELRRQKEARER